MAWDRAAFSFKTRWHETGLHSVLRQDGMRQDCIHFYGKLARDRTAFIFYDKMAWDRYSSILHRYVYTHIYTYICTYIYLPEGMFMYFFTGRVYSPYKWVALGLFHLEIRGVTRGFRCVRILLRHLPQQTWPSQWKLDWPPKKGECSEGGTVDGELEIPNNYRLDVQSPRK